MSSRFVYQLCELHEEVAILKDDHDPLRATAMVVSMDESVSSMRVRSSEPLDRGAHVKVAFNFTSSHPSDDAVEVDAEVFDRFPEPENDTWQIGVVLHFADAEQEQSLMTRLSSCEGLF